MFTVEQNVKRLLWASKFSLVVCHWFWNGQLAGKPSTCGKLSTWLSLESFVKQEWQPVFLHYCFHYLAIVKGPHTRGQPKSHSHFHLLPISHSYSYSHLISSLPLGSSYLIVGALQRNSDQAINPIIDVPGSLLVHPTLWGTRISGWGAIFISTIN